MKDTFASLLRHALTALVAAGTLLAQRGLIAPEDAAAVNASGVTLREALVVAGMAVLARLAMKAGGKIFVSNDNGTKNTGGNKLLVLGLVGLLGCALPACSSPGGMEPVPVRIGYKDKKGNVYSFDPVTGVTVQLVDGASGK